MALEDMNICADSYLSHGPARNPGQRGAEGAAGLHARRVSRPIPSPRRTSLSTLTLRISTSRQPEGSMQHHAQAPCRAADARWYKRHALAPYARPRQAMCVTPPTCALDLVLPETRLLHHAHTRQVRHAQPRADNDGTLHARAKIVEGHRHAAAPHTVGRQKRRCV